MASLKLIWSSKGRTDKPEQTESMHLASGQSVLIGRGSKVNIPLDDKRVSRQHGPSGIYR